MKQANISVVIEVQSVRAFIIENNLQEWFESNFPCRSIVDLINDDDLKDDVMNKLFPNHNVSYNNWFNVWEIKKEVLTKE